MSSGDDTAVHGIESYELLPLGITFTCIYRCDYVEGHHSSCMDAVVRVAPNLARDRA